LEWQSNDVRSNVSDASDDIREATPERSGDWEVAECVGNELRFSNWSSDGSCDEKSWDDVETHFFLWF
jgi:hypothetical protein